MSLVFSLDMDYATFDPTNKRIYSSVGDGYAILGDGEDSNTFPTKLPTKGLQFDYSKTQYLNIDDAAKNLFPFGNSPRTISIMFDEGNKPNTARQVLFSYGNPSSAGKHFGIWFHQDYDYFYASMNGGGLYYTFTSWGILKSLTHAVIVFPDDGQKIQDFKIYINGKETPYEIFQGINYDVDTEYVAEYPATIGNSRPSTPYWFHGKIYDVKVWDEALEASDIEELWKLLRSEVNNV